MSSDKTDGYEGYEKVYSSDYLLHESYNGETLAHDIALIKVKNDVGMDVFANLPVEKVDFGKNLTVVGWGTSWCEKMRFSIFAHPKSQERAGVFRVFECPQAPDTACDTPQNPPKSNEGPGWMGVSGYPITPARNIPGTLDTTNTPPDPARPPHIPAVV